MRRSGAVEGDGGLARPGPARSIMSFPSVRAGGRVGPGVSGRGGRGCRRGAASPGGPLLPGPGPARPGRPSARGRPAEPTSAADLRRGGTGFALTWCLCSLQVKMELRLGNVSEGGCLW